MDHMQFKANQTAAAYVAHELDEHAQEAFEVHMMGCSECLNDVEAWRVIKTHMPDAVVVETARQFKKHWWGGWGMAASFVGVMAVAAAGGFYGGTLQRPSWTRAKPRSSTCSPSRARKGARSFRWRRTRAPWSCE
ncbi:MAG: zf-HC2 domain-containing protein [Gammaproteobacteria bacterium]